MSTAERGGRRGAAGSVSAMLFMISARRVLTWVVARPVPCTPPSTYTAPRRTGTTASRRTLGSEFRRYFDDVEYGRRVLKFIRRSDTQDAGAHSPTELDASDRPERLALLAHEP